MKSFENKSTKLFLLVCILVQNNAIFTNNALTKENTIININQRITGISGTIPELIQEIITDFKNLAPNQPISNNFQNNLLLYGPTGNGKTKLASIIAQQTNSEFVEIFSTSIISTYQSSGPIKLNEVFEKALKILDKDKKVVILFDEIDAFASTHTATNYQEHSNTVAHFWLKVDKLIDNPNVLIIATTNKFKQLDPAFVNRFQILEIPNPSITMRREVINYFIKQINETYDPNFKIEEKKLDRLVTETNNLSIRSIKQIITAMQKATKSQINRPSTKKLVETEKTKSTIKPKEDALSIRWQKTRDVMVIATPVCLFIIGIIIGKNTK